MNPGDRLVVDMQDTANGFQVVIKDLTNHQSGEMTASTANGFANVNFNHAASTCTSSPFAFHPMYATSGTTTNVPWSAHTYNVSFADEIGHFEYCSTVGLGGQCIAGGDDLSPLDDFFCFDSTASSRVKIGGCRDTDVDFSGVPYQLDWPGTVPTKDKFLHPQPIQFTSPLLRPDGGGPLANYTNTAFEADMPAIEINCDPSTGPDVQIPHRMRISIRSSAPARTKRAELACGSSGAQGYQAPPTRSEALHLPNMARFSRSIFQVQADHFRPMRIIGIFSAAIPVTRHPLT